MTAANRRPGRPSLINQTVATTPAGEKITAAERITASLRLGDYFETACAAAGVHKETAYGWLRIGADATRRLARAEALAQPAPDLTPHERQCRVFSDAVASATAEWHRSALAQAEMLARGRAKVRTVTTKTDAAGNVVETVERVEELAPHAGMLMWRLERRLPELYGRRTVTDDDLVDDETAARSLAEELRSFQAAAAVLDVTGRDVTADGDTPGR
jgi:hypothetical protein